MGRLLLALGLVLLASGAGAEDLRDQVKDLLRSQGCAMPTERIAGVFAVMGHGTAEVEAAMDGLIESGGAALSPDRRTLVLAPAACHPPVAVPSPVAAVPWVEDRLAREPGCRMDRAALEDEAREAGVAPEDLARAAGDLVAVGRWVEAGGTLGLRADLCGPERAPDRPLARIEALEPEGLRVIIGLLAMDRGCRLPLADRPVLLRDLAARAEAQLGFGREPSPDAGAVLERRLATALEDPGPAYRIDPATDEIVARFCLPRRGGTGAPP